MQRQGDAHAVLVGVEVRAVLAVPQPQVHPVGEELHRREGRAEASGGEGLGFLVSWRCCEDEEGRCSLRRLRLGDEAGRGI